MLAKEGEQIDSCNRLRAGSHARDHRAGGDSRGDQRLLPETLAHDVAECRALALAAQRAGVVTQLGTQHAAGPRRSPGGHYLKTGVLGKVKRVILCSNRATAVRFRIPGRGRRRGRHRQDTGMGPVARHRAERRIHRHLSSQDWRSWQDFGTGWSGDIGCHIFDAVWKGLNLTAPNPWWPTCRTRGRSQRSAGPTPGRKAITSPGFSRAARRPRRASCRSSGTMANLSAGGGAGDRAGPGLCQIPGAALVIGTEGALLLPTRGAAAVSAGKIQGRPRPDLKGRVIIIVSSTPVWVVR